MKPDESKLEATAPANVADATVLNPFSGAPEEPLPAPESAGHPGTRTADPDAGRVGELTAEDLLFIQFMGC
jgi:hypothetical protein